MTPKPYYLEPLTYDQVLSPYIYVLYISFLVTLIFTPIMRMIALHYGIIDNPDRARKLHLRPIAYLGGVAVFLGWIAGLAISTFLRLHTSDPSQPQPVVMKFSIVSGACIIVLLGLWDDILSIPPLLKIGGQVFAAIFLLFDGIGTHCLQPVIDPMSHALQVRLGLPVMPEMVIVALSSLMVIGLVVGCCNASNLIDGLDGLCGGVTAIISAGLLFLALHLATSGGGFNANWDGIRVVVALALMGAILGFVPYNFNPASIFMGDTGSMFLGFVCAVLIMLMAQEEHPKWFLASMVMFALPVLDTALAFARRWINGRPIFAADRYHFHHQLLSRGYSVRKTVLISYLLAFFFALMGASIVLVRTRYSIAFWLIIFSYIVVAAYKMGMIHERPAVLSQGSLAKSEQEMSTNLEPESVLEISDTLQDGSKPGNSDGVQSHWDSAPAASRG
jgi:UDP-GlcNAc:undecaprenyl-phosphate/decaprenyl-phosphate GlcNAc-1-phosphate transferase